MTQEELDALMNGGLDDIDEVEEVSSVEEEQKEVPLAESSVSKKDDGEALYPLPATEENKMVHQLDDVTKESEEKASEIFDIIEDISNNLMDKEENINNLVDTLTSNVELFKTLNEKFPDVEAFSTQLEKNQASLDEANDVLEAVQNSGDSIMTVMDIMQYQDIHRQKIERVINVMRALSKYMNSLFEGKIEDEKRVSSAQHIIGDTHNELASTDDIEALLEQFGQQ